MRFRIKSWRLSGSEPSTGNIGALEDFELINLAYENVQALYAEEPVVQIFGRKIAEVLFLMISSQTNSLLILTPGAV